MQGIALGAVAASSNRTFMELKWQTDPRIDLFHKSSNRTFMELKYVRGNEDGWIQGVLIASLWN